MKTTDQIRAQDNGRADRRGPEKARKLVDDLKLLAELVDPSVDQIKKLAETIYQERTEKGVYGTPEDDWFKAEQILTTKV